MKSHNTFVFGIKNDRVSFIKSFDYDNEKEQAQEALKHVQNELLFDSWRISAAYNWVLENKNSDGDRLTISLPAESLPL